MKFTEEKQAEAVEKSTTDSIIWEANVEHILNTLLSDWRLIPVDGTDSKAGRILNKACGIDYLLCSNNISRVYSVACRVQYGKNYRTFVVPKDSETIGSFSPYYTMQVYVTDNKIAGLALVETKDLTDFIDRGLARERKADYVCRWDDLRAFGYEVKEYGTEPLWSGKVCYNGSPEILNSYRERFETDEQEADEHEKLHEAWRRIHEQYAEASKEKPDIDSIICGICEVTDILDMLEQLNQEDYYLLKRKRGLSHNY